MTKTLLRAAPGASNGLRVVLRARHLALAGQRRSRHLGADHGPVGGDNSNERAEFDVVLLPSGETRMYVGVGGGARTLGTPPALVAQYARFRRNDAVRNAPAVNQYSENNHVTAGRTAAPCCCRST